MADNPPHDERRLPAKPETSLDRRRFLRTATLGGLLGGAVDAERADAAVPTAAAVSGQAGVGLDRATLLRLAEVLLPSEVSAREREAAVDELRRWLREYRGDAVMGHGYGFTRVRRTAPSPESRYVEELAALQTAAQAAYQVGLEEIDDEALRALLAQAIEEAAPELQAIPGRPDAPHVAIALLSAYFRSAEATDRCYGVSIRREGCRGLFTDLEGLQPYAPGIVDADAESGR